MPPHLPPSRSGGATLPPVLDGSGDGGYTPPYDRLREFRAGIDLLNKYQHLIPKSDDADDKRVGASTDYHIYRKNHSPLTASPIQTTTYAPFNDKSSSYEDLDAEEDSPEYAQNIQNEERFQRRERFIDHLFNSLDNFNDFENDNSNNIDTGYRSKRPNSRRKRKSSEHQFKRARDNERGPQSGVRWWQA